ncbi:MAG: PepSY domain-containing protein [Pelomonas sp.]|nr:PepSY domain-containing protein [Roseateles sp.]
MPSPRALRVWSWLHTWSSLACTSFMLLLCLTGLPLIFHDEIDHLTGNAFTPPALNTPQAGEVAAPRASLDAVLAAARARYPDRVVQYASQPRGDARLWSVTLTPTLAPTFDFKSIAVDARTGRVLGEYHVGRGFMDLMLRLHTDLFAGQGGKLFLGVMGLLLLVALVSGALLYAPYIGRRAFGTVRRARAARIRWLDLHNLLGVATLVWCFVVGATGMINTWADLAVKHWQDAEVAALLGPDRAARAAPLGARVPYAATLAAAQAAAPGTRLAFVAFPGAAYSSPHHDTFFMRGATPLTARLLQPVRVDARTGAATAAPPLPWTLGALMLSQPLHFGDYGGLPLKLLWAALDLATLVVLGSGLYLWLQRHGWRARR